MGMFDLRCWSKVSLFLSFFFIFINGLKFESNLTNNICIDDTEQDGLNKKVLGTQLPHGSLELLA